MAKLMALRVCSAHRSGSVSNCWYGLVSPSLFPLSRWRCHAARRHCRHAPACTQPPPPLFSRGLPLPPFHHPAAPAVSPNPSSAAGEGHHLSDLTVLGRHLKSPCKTHAVLVLSTGGAPSSAPAARRASLDFSTCYLHYEISFHLVYTNVAKLCLEFSDVYIGSYRISRTGPLVVSLIGKDNQRVQEAALKLSVNTKSTSLIFRYSTLTEYLLHSAEEQNCSNQQQHSTVTWISGRGESAARAEEQHQLVLQVQWKASKLISEK
ncbi:hypothetical protein ZWY2020_016000 [Hordeum vulgare]|nr:hypothetical protein ZWY2020_016000 [Hordeum vulgare]